MRLGRGEILAFLVSCLFPGILAGCGFKSAGSGPAVTSGAGGIDAGTSTGSGGSAGSKGTGGHLGTGGTIVVGTGGLGDPGSGGDVGIAVDAAPPNCGQKSVSVMPVPPDILIVQDKSLSMNQDSSGANCTAAGCSKWSQVSAAMDTVVMATEGAVNWGLIFFGSDSMCGVNTTPSVPIAGNNYTAISQAYVNNQPSSYTPTESAVDAAAAYMMTVSDQNPKYLLLATDGIPNCKPGDRTVTDDDSPGATTAVMNAAAAGFPTFVVGIGNTMGDATLNMFATAGGEPQTGSADGNLFYEVNSTAELVAALTKIVGQATSCSFPLTGVSGDLEKVAVSAKDASGNTIEIMQDDVNGWSYTDATKTAIILNGDACKNLKSVTYTGFQFIYTCSTGIITIT